MNKDSFVAIVGIAIVTALLMNFGVLPHLFEKMVGLIIAAAVIGCVGFLLFFIFSGVGLTLLCVFGFVGLVLFFPLFPILLPLLFPVFLVVAVIVVGMKLIAS